MFQFRRFPTTCYFIHKRLTEYCSAGFPHSDIHGSRAAFASPWLFVDRYVLRRLLVPRHSPYALICLTIAHAPHLYLRYLRAANLRCAVGKSAFSLCYACFDFAFLSVRANNPCSNHLVLNQSNLIGFPSTIKLL